MLTEPNAAATETIAEKLSYLAETKNLIKAALEEKGAQLEGSPFRDYPQAISNLSAEQGKYSRPTDWLPLPQVPAAGNHVYMLMALWPNSINSAAIKATAGSSYNVEWGDGQIQTMASGTIAQYAYSFDTLPANTVTSKGYKQVWIHIYGDSLTEVDFQQSHSAYPNMATNFQELIVDAPSLTSIRLCQGSLSVSHPYLERAELRRCPLENMQDLFLEASSLKEVSALDLSAATNISNLFKSCYLLENVPEVISAPVAVTAAYVFRDCSALKCVGDITLPVATTINNIFGYCKGLKSVKSVTAPAATNAAGAFQYCVAMEETPELDLPVATLLNTIFANCYALRKIPKFSIPSNTANLNAFIFCYALEYIGLENVGRVSEISFAKTRLSRQELVRIFALLPTAAHSPAVDITNVAGASHLTEGDKLLLTSRGWRIKS